MFLFHCCSHLRLFLKSSSITITSIIVWLLNFCLNFTLFWFLPTYCFLMSLVHASTRTLPFPFISTHYLRLLFRLRAHSPMTCNVFKIIASATTEMDNRSRRNVESNNFETKNLLLLLIYGSAQAQSLLRACVSLSPFWLAASCLEIERYNETRFFSTWPMLFPSNLLLNKGNLLDELLD